MNRYLHELRRRAGSVLIVCAVALSICAPAFAQEMSPATQKLFEAVHNGDLAQVQVSIAGGGDINAVNTWGVTPVDLAVDKGHFDIVHFLLQVRELQAMEKKTPPAPAPAAVTSLSSATGDQMAAQPSTSKTAQPLAAPVAEVYSPPPGSDPWSATVVTTEPPTPPPPSVPAGPNPFDKKSPVAETSLPIIGNVRGPAGDVQPIDTSTQVAVEDTFQEVVSTPQPVVEPTPVTKPKEKSAAKPAEEKAAVDLPAKITQPEEEAEESGVWNNIKSFLNLDSRPDTAETPETAPTPTPKAVDKNPQPVEKATTPAPRASQSAALAQPTAPVSPPNVKGPPPPIEEKVLPEDVNPAPLTNLPEDDLEAPRVLAVQPKKKKESKTPPEPHFESVSKKTKPETEKNPTIKVTRLSESEKKEPPKIAESSIPEKPVRVGTTTLPGKPRDQKGFFTKMMSVFSSDEDEEKKEVSKHDEFDDTEETSDWSVKDVQQAKVVPKKPSKKATRKLPENRLDGIILSLAHTTALGKEPPPQMPAPWYYKSCLSKKRGSIVFCIEPLDWPEDILPHFLTDSIMYEGAKTIVRYDEGSASYYHTLFPSTSYKAIVEYLSRRYGPPTKKLTRSIAPLAEQRRDNPTAIWQSIAPVTNLLTTLEIRQYDDNRGGFPDTRRGAVYLYHEWSQPVFPQLSSVELMLLKAEEKQR